jgi:hypothetical protein
MQRVKSCLAMPLIEGEGGTGTRGRGLFPRTLWLCVRLLMGLGDEAPRGYLGHVMKICPR